MRSRLLWDDLQSSLWFRPALWIVGMGLLALLLPQIDSRLSVGQVRETLPWWLYVDSAEGARTMLGALGSAMLTVATLAFSILMVAVVQTANAYSPRILREYLSDTGNQHVMGILVGTFLYTLLVLRRIDNTDSRLFIPMLSISVALLLSILSVIAFIYFINHVAHSIEVSAIVERIHDDTLDMMRHLFPMEMGQPWQGAEPPPLPPGEPMVILATQGGYIEAITSDELLRAMTRANAVLRLDRMIGDYVLPHTPLATLWPSGAVDDALPATITGTINLGRERTMVQDLLYGVRQLSDIALRALSPAINDPSTAVNCIDMLGTLLVEMSQRAPVSPYRCDEAGALRIIAPGPTFTAMIDLAFTQVRRYAATDLVVTLRVIEVCQDLAHVARAEAEQEAIWRHLLMMGRSAARHIEEPLDRALVNQRLQEAARVLGREPLLMEPNAPVVV